MHVPDWLFCIDAWNMVVRRWMDGWMDE